MSDSPYSDFRESIRFVDIQARFEDTAEGLFSKFQFDGLDPDAALIEVLGRFEKVIRSANGPIFDDAGFIPPLQICTEAEVVRWFGFTDHREQLLDRVHKWIRLARAIKARRLLLDGSFVTDKSAPGDVDAVVLLPYDFHTQLSNGNSEAVELFDMFCTGEPKEVFIVEDEDDWWRWFGFFSRTREANGRYKGLIEVKL